MALTLLKKSHLITNHFCGGRFLLVTSRSSPSMLDIFVGVAPTLNEPTFVPAVLLSCCVGL